MVDSQKDASGYRDILEKLLRSWSDDQSGEFLIRRALAKRSSVGDAKFFLVFGLTAHTHHSAKILLSALTPELPNAAMPLVRAMYECALTAQWVVLVKDSAEAVVNEGIRQRTLLQQDMGKLPAHMFEEGTPEVAHASDPYHDSFSNAMSRHFKQMCNDLVPGGDEAYLYYRALSALSHAGPMVADHYVADTDDGYRLRPNPSVDAGNNAFLHLAACSLLWAGRALDIQDRGQRRRTELRAVARDLGTVDMFKLSGHYHRRMTAATQEARRQKTQGPNAKRKPS